MPTRVHTLTETTDRTGYVLGVFADRAMAVGTALSHAHCRIERCNTSDEKTFGDPVPPGTYTAVLIEPDEHAKVVILHQPSGEIDGVSWHIWPFDVVERPTEPDGAQAEFCNAAA